VTTVPHYVWWLGWVYPWPSYIIGAVMIVAVITWMTVRNRRESR
jgi:hypothetical protein